MSTRLLRLAAIANATGGVLRPVRRRRRTIIVPLLVLWLVRSGSPVQIFFAVQLVRDVGLPSRPLKR